MATKDIKLIAIVGPTASGKTGLSIDVAKKYDGEVVSADSRAIYKYMDIGTAKPSKDEQAGILHWGIDLVGPGQDYSVADYKKYADKKIDDIKNRHKLALLVGGTGLYVDSVLYDFSLAPKNPKIRFEMADKTITQLQQIIKDKKLQMPENLNNKRYLIRAIERGNAPLLKKLTPKDALIVGICPNKIVLQKKIEKRLDNMLKDGVVDEIKLCANKYGWDSTAMTGGIYRAFKGYIQGTCSIEESKENFIKSDLLLAKRQMTWFKRNKDIRWFDNPKDALVWLDKQLGAKL
ncbi:MAG: tRNA (adenosine(37)-N6)-dimethylallyltransferase MiaA [Candidatus Saccharibacteria bacterium]